MNLTAQSVGAPGPRFPGAWLVILGLSALHLSGAELRLADAFADKMVVQRDQPIRVWGQSAPDTEVEVRLANSSGSARTGSDGRWHVVLDPLPAGGPYTLTAISGANTVKLTDVLCGDVWLCSGQSNMQFPVKEADPNEQKVALVEVPRLRLCAVAKVPAAKPVSSAKIDWRLCTPDSSLTFSAVARFFAAELLKAPALRQIPLGIVDCSFGGTTCEAWIPQPALADFATEDLHDSFLGFKPSQHYNGMVAPLGPTAFRGVLWYQGESNSGHPETYPALFATMVSEWRKQFYQPSLPFIVIQLPEYANLWEGFYWPWIREMQAKAVESVSNCALVVALQTTDGFDLHPKEKLEIGRRSALVARRFVYGEDLLARGPVFEGATAEGSTIRVKFETAGDGLASSNPQGLHGFSVAGADGEYYFANARIEDESVVLQSDSVPRPQTVRYAWGGMPQATLVNKAGLPAAPFRTDHFPYSNVEVQPQRCTRRVATSTYEVVISAEGMPTSLVVRGAQFLSNEAGGAGGGTIPGFWGPRTLANIRETGPRLLTCQDEEVVFQTTFDERSLQWTLANHGKDPITYQLALSPLVHVPDSLTGGRALVTRGSVSVTFEGVDSVTNTPAGPMLITQIKSGSTRTITLK